MQLIQYITSCPNATTLQREASYFFLVYLAGWGLSLADFRLYNSEADQQRNFNIVMSGWLLLSIVGAAWLSRRKKLTMRCSPQLTAGTFCTVAARLLF